MFSEIPQTDMAHLPNPLPADLVIIDVREDDEWAAGHVDNSVHIPLMQVPRRLDDVPRDRPVLVVCAVGARSARAAAFLQAEGIDATNLIGGLVAWEYAGRPLVVDSAPSSQPS